MSNHQMAVVKVNHMCSTMAIADQTETKMAASLAVTLHSRLCVFSVFCSLQKIYACFCGRRVFGKGSWTFFLQFAANRLQWSCTIIASGAFLVRFFMWFLFYHCI